MHNGKSSINTEKFRRLFAHEERLDWVGNGQSTHGMFKEATEDRLSVLLDLSSFPSDQVYFGVHLRSGSGFASDVVQEYSKCGLPVDFFARIIKIEETIPAELKS